MTKVRGKKRGPKPKKFGRVPHRARPVHKGRHPVHVTLRARYGLPSFRQQVVRRMVLDVLRAQQKRAYRDAFQIVEFSIQSNHVHMLVEADDGPPKAPSNTRKKANVAGNAKAQRNANTAHKTNNSAKHVGGHRNALRAGVSGFVIAFARRLNALLKRKGKVWDHRYHRHDLTTPHEVKTSLRYVVNNFRKHGETTHGVGAFDIYSSAQEFTGWREPPTIRILEPEPWLQRTPRTWLLARGWRRHGLIDLTEVPGARVRV